MNNQLKNKQGLSIKFSILMSVYFKDNPVHLDDTLRSLFDSSIIPSQIVLVKDGRLTEELDQTIEKYVNNYPEIFTITENETNLGLGLSLSKGLDLCRYNLVARMDADDLSVKDRFEIQIKYLNENSNIAIVGGQIEEFSGDPKHIIGKRLVPLDNSQIMNYMKYRCPMNHVTVMFKKDAILAAGGYQDWPWNEDYYLWIRMHLSNLYFANVPQVLVKVRSGKEMYQRRGGKAYFKSEKNIQRYMLENKVITHRQYFVNVFLRFLLQVVMTNKFRGFVYKTLARDN